MTTGQTNVFLTKHPLLKAQYQALLDQSASVGLVQSYVDYMRVVKAVEIPCFGVRTPTRLAAVAQARATENHILRAVFEKTNRRLYLTPSA